MIPLLLNVYITVLATRIFVVMFTKWNNDIMTKPARPPLDLGEALTRNRITTWSGLSAAGLPWLEHFRVQCYT